MDIFYRCCHLYQDIFVAGYGFRPDLYDPSALSYAPNDMPSAPQAPHWHHPQDFPPVGPGHLPPGPPGNVEMHNGGYFWVNNSTFSNVPMHAVRGGTDSDGSEIFVGRAFVGGDWCPAKIVPARGEAYVAFDSQEHVVTNYDVLCEQRFQWVPAYGGQVPPNAVCGGQTSDGERLYIGRAYHEGSSTVGKVTNLSIN